MTRYNFSEISDFEFESLCRDLLQAELDLPLELFAPGPDGGIDVRYIGITDGREQTIVAQCKRWAEDSFRRLLRYLVKVELPKIAKIAPERYILLTAVPLSPGRKDKVVDALRPWIRSPADVLGRDDLSGLLARHTDVERRHIKLWLTSTEVLDALLNSDIAMRSEGAVERAQRQLRLWVPNPSFERALKTLDENRVCVISGAPGIGKTMLADVLLADYTSRKYEPVVISDDIAEAERVWRSGRRQIFHYDDFLGHVTYGELQLRKNEESRLAHFLERVRQSEEKRFVLTTREYILSEALRRYERLSDLEFDIYKTIVSLDDYTSIIRAQILYNHLFFSELPQNLKTALVHGGRYWNVIRHPNYNPRVIDHAVSLPGVENLASEGFVSSMIASLDNPTRVWERIFDNLPTMARRILLTMASLPANVLLADLRAAARGLSPADFDPGEFRSAIGMIEGTFIDLGEASPGHGRRDRIVALRDASVRDYLWGRLEAVDGEAELLLAGAIFFEQCVILYEGQHHASSLSGGLLGRAVRGTRSRVVVDYEAVARRAIELIDSPSPQLRRWGIDGPEYFSREGPKLERRAAFLAGVFAEHQASRAVAGSAASALGTARTAWEAGRGSPSEGIHLIRQAKRVEGLLPEAAPTSAERALLGLIEGRLDESEDFTALVDLARLSPHLFEPPNRSLESWGAEFADFLEGERHWLLHDIDDPDSLAEEMRALERLAGVLGANTAELATAVDERIVELEEQAEDERDDEDEREPYSDPQEESAEAEIDALFQSLL